MNGFSHTFCRLLSAAFFSFLILYETTVAHSQGIIPPEKVAEIKKCVEDKLTNGAIAGRLVWRTHYRYFAASNNGFSAGYYRFSTCKLETEYISPDGDWHQASIVDQYKPVNDGEVIEGMLQKGGKLAPLRDCDRYRFIAPVTAWNDDGDAVHDAYPLLNSPQQLHCGFYTAGDGKLFGGGGHIYFGCKARLEPVFNDKDKAGFLELCAREILK